MRLTFNTISITALALTLAACGGGGSGGGVNSPGTNPPPVNPNPNPNPNPDPNPVPKPTPTEIEASKSLAAKAMKADYAYQNGITGKGVTVAIIDTGIDLEGSEFTGRISADSKSFSSTVALCQTCAPETVTFGLDDQNGHGTKVAAIAVGAKDGSGIHGIAYEADLLALKIAAPELEGVSDISQVKEGTTADSRNIAPAIRYAVEKGAFVISMSLNGTSTGQTALDQRAAMDFVRSNDRLFVQSITNSSGVDSFAGSIAESLVGTDLTNKDWFLFGIRVNENLQGVVNDGTPGALADRTLAVVAHNVETVGKDGEAVIVTGNSFAAPAIAGAAALLKQYWPQLGGRDISRILLDTATDLGAPGVDQQYGVGLLNIEQAMKAQAPKLGLSAATTSEVADTSLVFSGAFGGADASAKFSSAAGHAVVLDRYGRDYQMQVGALAGAFRPGGIRLGHMQSSQRNYAPAMNQSAALVNYTAGLSAHNETVTQSGHFAFRTSAKSAVSGAVNASIERSNLVTGRMFQAFGLASQGSNVTFSTSGYAVGFSTANTASRDTSSSLQQMMLSTPEGFTFGLTNAREKGSALGLRGTGAFKIDGAKSTFATVGWTGTYDGFRLTAEAMGGRTKVTTNSDMLQFSEAVLSSGFRFQADHRAFGGNLSFGITSPLRVENANLRYTAPVAYNLETQEMITKTTEFGIAPDAREMNYELGWARSFGKHYLSIGGAYSTNAANQRGVDSLAGWARFSTSF